MYKLRLNPNKCTFEARSGKLLGFIVSERGIEVDPAKVKAIQEMPVPKTEKQVRGFLGRLNYISRFISHMTATCALSHYAKNRREKDTEPPPCVIYPKGGKGNARSKPGKEWSHDQRCKIRESVMRREGISTLTHPSYSTGSTLKRIE